ncbi:MAG: hypothetical protein E6H05_13790 [Bacillati bacterium ANGP1]|uniref:Copper-binding protein n=1 Tax=Candidatus Segetimicrobium genomatis TaxID=2569760 RepID=A0A537IGD6_9BACT|nr:MAG: hypothetical protein E6H05_13790 [Terrabacteria group bacterium ANGP1]
MGRILGILGILLVCLPGRVLASHTGWLFATGNRIVITMTTYPRQFTPNAVTLEAGKVVDLVLENKGTGTHIFMVYPPPQTPPKGSQGWWEYVMANTYFQDMGEVLVHGKRDESYVAATRLFEVGVEAGKTITITFIPAKKGTFEMASHLLAGEPGGDYERGMKGAFIVK